VRYISWIITLPIALFAVLFAISNRDPVTFALWPTPFTLEAPIYLATLLALVVGFVAGGVIAWAAQHRNRTRARRAEDRVFYLEREVQEAQTRAAAAEKRVAELTRPVSGQPPRTSLPAAVEASAQAPAIQVRSAH